jgi:hypothetical protein
MSKFSEEISDTVIKDLIAPEQVEMLQFRVTKKVGSAFTGGSANTHGDFDGTGMPYSLFTVVGDVIVKALVGIVNVTLTGATSTIEVGVVGNTAGLLAQETCTDLSANAVYTSATNAVKVAATAFSGAHVVIANGSSIIETLGTANATAGQIDWYCIWAPLEQGASVKAA